MISIYDWNRPAVAELERHYVENSRENSNKLAFYLNNKSHEQNTTLERIRPLTWVVILIIAVGLSVVVSYDDFANFMV